MRRSVHIAVAKGIQGAAGVQVESSAQRFFHWAEKHEFVALKCSGETRPTHRAVSSAIESQVAALTNGDLLLLTFAGHGELFYAREQATTETTARDCAAKSSDGEMWALEDGMLTDSELRMLLAPCGDETDVVVVSDACYGLGILDAGSYIARAVCGVERVRSWARTKLAGAVVRPNEFTARGIVISPTDEMRLVDVGYTHHLLDALEQDSAGDYETLRGMSEARWKAASSQPEARFVCAKPVGATPLPAPFWT